MTLRHIRIFLAVCENGNNTTRAARALYLAQPAVSRAVAELEEYYGVRLFDRIGPVMWTHSARHTPGWMCASGWGRRSSLRKSCCTTRWTSL